MNTTYHNQDVKHLRAPANVTETALVWWCAACFVMGAAGMYVVLGVLSMGAA